MDPDNRDFFATTSLTDVTLRVRDLGRMLAFYRDQVGLREIGRRGPAVELSATGKSPSLVTLVEGSGGPSPTPTAASLFHLAILLPGRADLGTVVRRLIGLGVPMEGAADHGVSEAFYLSDPEGNGVELYCDKAPYLWPLAGDQVAMVTEPLDHQAILSLGRPDATKVPLPADTRIGHVHLSVSDLPAAEKLFAGTLGMAVRQRNFPGALFFAHDGYHHHLAANTWRGTRRPSSNGLGLASFTLHHTPAPLRQGGNPAPLTAAGLALSFSGEAVTMAPS
jgi:catechol 2,3-dioxygenase